MTKKFLLIYFFILASSFLFAAEDKILTVATYNAPPFVIVDKSGKVSGFSITLLDKLQKYIEPPITLKYKVFPDIKSSLNAVTNGEVDLGIGATTITSQREQNLDFSHPFYRTATGIMIKSTSAVNNIFRMIFHYQALMIICYIIIYMIICSHIIWFLERGNGVFHTKYFKGVSLGLWWTVCTMSTVGYGDVFPKRALGKIFGFIVICSGIAIFSFAIVTFTSSITIKQLNGIISGPNDLEGKTVAVIKNTSAIEEVEERDIRIIQVNDIKQGIDAIESNQAVALVQDVPLLKYYLNKHPYLHFRVLKNTFDYIDYGIEFKKFSRFRKEFNIALMKFIEDGGYEKLNHKWF